MRGRGLLFTLGAFLIGGVLVTFGLTHDLASKAGSSENRLMELDRAAGQSTNLADNLRKAFTESGIGVGQTDGAISVTESLPNNLTGYRSRTARLRDFAERMLDNATIACSEDAAFTTDFGVNYTHDSERTARLQLPDNTVGLAFAGFINQNISSCNLTAEPGGVAFAAAVEGNPGGCAVASDINMGSLTRLDLNGGGVVLTMEDRMLQLNNNLIPLLNYNLTVRVNESRRRMPPKLEGHVSTEVLECGKDAEVML